MDCRDRFVPNLDKQATLDAVSLPRASFWSFQCRDTLLTGQIPFFLLLPALQLEQLKHSMPPIKLEATEELQQISKEAIR